MIRSSARVATNLSSYCVGKRITEKRFTERHLPVGNPCERGGEPSFLPKIELPRGKCKFVQFSPHIGEGEALVPAGNVGGDPPAHTCLGLKVYARLLLIREMLGRILVG